MTDVHFARSGDVDVAYDVVGDGPIDLVYVEGAYTHLEIAWELPAYRRFCERLAEFTRLIRFDKRGMGMSDRAPGATTLEERGLVELRGLPGEWRLYAVAGSA